MSTKYALCNKMEYDWSGMQMYCHGYGTTGISRKVGKSAKNPARISRFFYVTAYSLVFIPQLCSPLLQLSMLNELPDSQPGMKSATLDCWELDQCWGKTVAGTQPPDRPTGRLACIFSPIRLPERSLGYIWVCTWYRHRKIRIPFCCYIVDARSEVGLLICKGSLWHLLK